MLAALAYVLAWQSWLLKLAQAPPPGLVLDGDASFAMPAIGFGTCCRKSATGQPLVDSTKSYLSQGGRLIDTAQMYGNHKDIARAIRESGVPRSEIWITSKVNTHRVKTREAAVASIDKSAAELGVAYIDLMLIHGARAPAPHRRAAVRLGAAGVAAAAAAPLTGQCIPPSDLGTHLITSPLLRVAARAGLWTIDIEQAVEVWRGLIDAKAKGTVRHSAPLPPASPAPAPTRLSPQLPPALPPSAPLLITTRRSSQTFCAVGVSNFEVPHIQRVVAATAVKPALLQLEFHPWALPQAFEAVDWCKANGIAVTAYGSLGGAQNQARGEAVAAVATAHGVLPSQVLLRWATARGVAVIPGATSAEHIGQNLALPPLALSEAELAALGSTAARPAEFKAWGNLPVELASKPKKGGGRKMSLRQKNKRRVLRRRLRQLW